MLDDTDRKMLGILSRNPDVPQTELAKSLGITQPAVCLRLKKLQEEGVLKKCAGLDPAKVEGEFYLVVGRAPLQEMKALPGFVLGFVADGRSYAVLYGVSVGNAPKGFEMVKIEGIEGHFSIPVKAEEGC